MTHWEPLVAKIVALPGEKLVETKLAVDSAFQPTEWSGSWCRGIADLLIVDGDKAAVLDWKGLPTSTEIPTPSGFKTMGDLAVGDYVFGGDGKPCTVVGKFCVAAREEADTGEVHPQRHSDNLEQVSADDQANGNS